MTKPIHLDTNATTPVLPEVQAVMACVQQHEFGNPSSGHSFGKQARETLATAREALSRYLGAQNGQVIFNSGATEGINTAIFSALRPYAGKNIRHRYLLYLATEHKAVPTALAHWNQVLGVNATLQAIPVTATGQVCLDTLSSWLPDALLVCTMAVNNETGVVQPLTAIRDIIRHRAEHIPWLVDGVQALGKVPVNLAQLDIDYFPVSAHKLYGPKGSGALYVSNRAPYTPLLVGGGQEDSARGGTENTAAIAAWPVLIDLLHQSPGPFWSREQLMVWRERLLNACRQAFPDVIVNQPDDAVVPTVLNVSVPGYTGAELAGLLEYEGLAVSTGSACSSGHSHSYVVAAHGVPDWQASGAVRISIGAAAPAAHLTQAIRKLEVLGTKRRFYVDAAAPGLYSRQIGNRVLFGLLHHDQLVVPGSEAAGQEFRVWFSSHYAPTPELRVLTPVELRSGFAVGDYRMTMVGDMLEITYVPSGRVLQCAAGDGAWLTPTLQAPAGNLQGGASAETSGAAHYDVRQPWERRLSGTSAATSLQPLPVENWYHFALTAPHVDQPVLYCRSGQRSQQLCELLACVGVTATARAWPD